MRSIPQFFSSILESYLLKLESLHGHSTKPSPKRWRKWTHYSNRWNPHSNWTHYSNRWNPHSNCWSSPLPGSRFLINRPIRSYMMMEKIETFWSPLKGIKIQEIETCLYTFQFNHQLDFQIILKKRPWYFDNHLLVLDILLENSNIDQVAITFVLFWIQVHNILLGYRTEKARKDITNYIGEFLEYDVKNNSNYLRTYMRIRVLLDVTKPLKWQEIKIKSRGKVEKHLSSNSITSISEAFVITALGHIEGYRERLFFLECDDEIRLWAQNYVLTSRVIPEEAIEGNIIKGVRCKWSL